MVKIVDKSEIPAFLTRGDSAKIEIKYMPSSLSWYVDHSSIILGKDHEFRITFIADGEKTRNQQRVVLRERIDNLLKLQLRPIPQ